LSQKNKQFQKIVFHSILFPIHSLLPILLVVLFKTSANFLLIFPLEFPLELRLSSLLSEEPPLEAVVVVFVVEKREIASRNVKIFSAINPIYNSFDFEFINKSFSVSKEKLTDFFI